ncbi:hypothetical protein OH77DRAFT_1322428 [Trametes cingulata]|nr:hypothetical protein OH77DRAFT_1322428 [Trametes cingulata]
MHACTLAHPALLCCRRRPPSDPNRPRWLQTGRGARETHLPALLRQYSPHGPEPNAILCRTATNGALRPQSTPACPPQVPTSRQAQPAALTPTPAPAADVARRRGLPAPTSTPTICKGSKWDVAPAKHARPPSPCLYKPAGAARRPHVHLSRTSRESRRRALTALTSAPDRPRQQQTGRGIRETRPPALYDPATPPAPSHPLQPQQPTSLDNGHLQP